jgi:23S rRNA pseudouridine1911/1915/1917 synthase
MSNPEVLFEDNHLLIVNKKAGILTQPSGTEQLNLEQICKTYLKKKYHKPGNVFLEAVHRLDKPVSGIVVFARTSKSLGRLQEAMREKKCKKMYLALIEGTLPKQEDHLENYILHDEHRSMITHQGNPHAKKACLHYKFLKEKNGSSLVEILLDTGRYHQIRVQFAHLGCPILGDRKYGSRICQRENEIALHHFRMVLPHPIIQNCLSFEVLPPWEMLVGCL